MKLIKYPTIALALAATLSGTAFAQTPAFTPGRIAVLQLGDGGPGRCAPLGAITGITNYNASDIAGSRQTPLFIDEFDPNAANQTNNYSVQVAVPTNGPGAMLINGNAGTEGGMTLSADKSLLTFAGYQGDILSITTGGQTAPSNLSYDRGIGTVDAFATYANPYRGGGWYGIATGKTNPRGVATDGAGSFWGCGNGYGSLYFTASLGQPIQFQNIALTSFSKICNNTLYASVKKSEAVNLYPAGIYSFVDFFNNPVAYPTTAAYLHLEIPAEPAFSTIIGFDINPQNTVAYVADTAGGIQKYVKSGLNWQIAYNLAIPGYLSQNSGIMAGGVIANPGATNNLVGAFSLTVDWSGPNPVIYATTSDTTWTNSPYYGNRVIRINDTNAVVIGTNSILATTNILTTLVHPPVVAGIMLTNVVYKSVTFTPDLRPVIATNPASLSAVVGNNVSFNVVATSSFTLNYQWQENGTNLPGQNTTSLNLSNVQLTDNSTTYQCVITNNYGAITSAVATLQVSLVPTFPAWSMSNITNYIGNSVSIPVNFTNGTDPKGGFQWFHDGTPLSDGGEYAGTATSALLITQIGAADSGAYSVIVTNLAGSVTGLVANFTALYAPPIFVQPPVAGITFFGHNFTNSVSAYGVQLNYQWYKSSKTTLSGSTLTPITDVNEFSGTATSVLGITGATNSSATNYVVVVSNPGGSITSAPVALTVQLAPPHTFAAYNNAGQVYLQNFNTLPIPGLGSAEGANPLHVPFVMTSVAGMLTNGNPGVITTISADLTYSVDNPVDFGYPIITNGSIGGWGLSNSMSGWYGWCQKSMVIAAGRGDQSQGAIVDNGGNYYADGASLAGVTNRSLGLVATTKTGPNAIGLALVNRTGKTLSSINLSYLGELWRNNPNPQPLKFGYVITDTNSVFQPDLWDATNGIIYVPSLDVVFPTSATTTVNDGTQSSNQVSLAVSGMTIADWPPGAVLWLTWQAQTLGTSQDVAIDNVTFSTPGAPFIVAQPTNQTVVVGSPASFSVSAGGIPAPLVYQWLKNGANIGAGLTSLPFGSVTTNDAANYSVIITNTLGSITSSVAKLTVLVPGTALTSTVTGAALKLAWPADQIGWNLQVQTNALSKGVGTNWFIVPNSATTNAVALPLNPTNPAVFFRLKF